MFNKKERDKRTKKAPKAGLVEKRGKARKASKDDGGFVASFLAFSHLFRIEKQV